jgi:thiol:disulfide interchange protein
MKNNFLSRFDADNLRKAIIFFVIALSLIIISLILGIEDSSLAALMFPFGIAFFFYALLRPWGNAKYYGIMCIIIILFALMSIGLGILTKWQLYNNLGKDFGEYIELIVPIGVIVGIIGIFRFRKYD